jgi:hypothetical protein
MTDGVYRVTRHSANTTVAETGILLYSSTQELEAWRFYQSFRPLPRMTLALWRPDGSLVASRSGPMTRPTL